jgi:predicted transcriptional regulator
MAGRKPQRRREFGTTRKLPSGRWQARYIGPDGQRYTAPETFDTTPVLLYATAPTMALVGMARIASVHVASPKEVWSAHRAQTGISRREYDAYMSGATQASGLTLEDPVSFDEPVTLNALRTAGTFHPPQSYRYLKSDDLRQVSEAGPAVGSALRLVLPDLVHT